MWNIFLEKKTHRGADARNIRFLQSWRKTLEWLFWHDQTSPPWLLFWKAFTKPQSKLDPPGKYGCDTWPVFFCNKQLWTLPSTLMCCKVPVDKDRLWLVDSHMPGAWNSSWRVTVISPWWMNGNMSAWYPGICTRFWRYISLLIQWPIPKRESNFLKEGMPQPNEERRSGWQGNANDY